MIDSEEYLINGDLEKDIIGMFFIDSKKTCISKTILQPKHFLDDTNRRMFMLLKGHYQKTGNLDIQEIIKEYEGKSKVQQIISDYYTYASLYVVGIFRFTDNEKRLIERWQRVTSQELMDSFKKGEIDYKTLKIKLDEVNQNQFFKNILEVTEDVEAFSINDTKEREYTDIRQLDWLTKGIEYGTLNVWSAITNAGKTTLMTQFVRTFIRKGKKVFFFNGEQTSREFKNNLYVTMCNKEQIEYVKDKNNQNIVDIVPKEEMTRYLDNITKDKLYIYNNDIPRNDIDTMMSVMEEAFRKGVRIFFIDNFMQLDNSEQLDQQTKIVEKFKRFARDKNTIVILVAHPRKLNFGTTRLNVFDISGTQNIANKASNICTIIRTDTMNDNERKIMEEYLLKNNYLIRDCNSIIEVLKTKGNKNGVVGLSYDPDFKTFKEVRKLTPDEKGRMNL